MHVELTGNHRAVRRHGRAWLCAAATAGALVASATLGSTGASADDTAPPAPTGVSVTFVQWFQGADRFHVSWDGSDQTLDHFLIEASGTDVSGIVSERVDGDQTGADIDIPTGRQDAADSSISFDVKAWSADGMFVSQPSDPVVADTDFGVPLTAVPENGVLHQVQLSWPAPADGDQVVLTDTSTGQPVSVADPTTAGSLVVGTGTAAWSDTYSLAEQVIADPDQLSPATRAQSRPAPVAVTAMTADFGSGPDALHLSWGLPAGCPTAYWITHCMEVRAVAKEGTVAPTSPTDGTILSADPAQPGIENYGTTLTGFQLGHTYTIAVFNTPWQSLTAWGPAVTTTVDDQLWPEIDVTRDVATVTYGSAVTLHASVSRPDTAAALTDLPISLAGATHAGAIAEGHGVTDGSGRYAVTFHPTWTASYQFTTAGTPDYYSTFSDSDQAVIDVRPTLSIHLSHAKVRHGSTVTVSGTLNPHRVSTIALQRYSHGKWSTVTSTHCSSSGAYSFHVHTSAKGTFSYRVERPGDSLLVTGVSATTHLSVD